MYHVICSFKIEDHIFQQITFAPVAHKSANKNPPPTKVTSKRRQPPPTLYIKSISSSNHAQPTETFVDVVTMATDDVAIVTGCLEQWLPRI